MAATTVLCARFRESFDRMGNFVSHTDGQPERQEGRREGRHSKLYRTEALVRPSVVRPPVSREGRRGREATFTIGIGVPDRPPETPRELERARRHGRGRRRYSGTDVRVQDIEG